jgi:hypothetical protein
MPGLAVRGAAHHPPQASVEATDPAAAADRARQLEDLEIVEEKEQQRVGPCPAPCRGRNWCPRVRAPRTHLLPAGRLARASPSPQSLSRLHRREYSPGSSIRDPVALLAYTGRPCAALILQTCAPRGGRSGRQDARAACLPPGVSMPRFPPRPRRRFRSRPSGGCGERSGAGTRAASSTRSCSKLGRRRTAGGGSSWWE